MFVCHRHIRIMCGLVIIVAFESLAFGQSTRASALEKILLSDTLTGLNRGEILVELGKEYVRSNEPVKATTKFELGLDLFKTDKRIYLRNLEEVGYVFSDEGKLAIGIEYLLRAMEYAESEEIKDREIRILCNIGNIYVDYDQDTFALDYLNRSRQKTLEYGDLDFLKYIDYSKSGLYINMVISDSAIFYLNRSYKAYLEENDIQMLINIYNSLSLIHKGKKRLDSAQYWIEKSIENEIRYPDYADLGISYFNYGRILIDKKDFKAAKRELLKSLDEIKTDSTGNWRRNMARTFFGLGQAEAGLGDYKKGYEYLIGYDSISTKYENEVVSNRIAELTASAERFRIERERDLNKFQLEKEKQKNMIIIIVLIVIVLFGVFWIYSNEQKKKTLRDLAKRNQQLANQKINDLLQQQEIHSLQGVLVGQETERKRIAGDLHDKLGAILSMVKLHFSAVEERLDAVKTDNRKQYEKANELLDEAASEVRNISHNLISGVLTKFGLVPALKDLKETVESTGKLNIQLIVNDMVERLNGEQELQLYRIIQELISNILKHANATEAVIQLNRINGQFNLIIEDNGIGFDVEAVKLKDGIGLKNLEARVNKLEGTLHFDTGKGAGTTVSIDIPLEDD